MSDGLSSNGGLSGGVLDSVSSAYKPSTPSSRATHRTLAGGISSLHISSSSPGSAPSSPHPQQASPGDGGERDREIETLLGLHRVGRAGGGGGGDSPGLSSAHQSEEEDFSLKLENKELEELRRKRIRHPSYSHAFPTSVPGYRPIEEHGLIGNMRTCAIVSVDAAITWYWSERQHSSDIHTAPRALAVASTAITRTSTAMLASISASSPAVSIVSLIPAVCVLCACCSLCV